MFKKHTPIIPEKPKPNYRKLLESMAQEHLEEVLIYAEKHRLILQENLEKDRNSFSFKCNRFGDFLVIYVTFQKEHIAMSINLSKVSSINYIKGRPPGRKGVVNFGWRIEPNNSGTYYSTLTFPTVLASGDEFKVYPCYPFEPNHTLFVEEYMRHSVSGMYGVREDKISFSVPNFPSPYESDKIYFDGFDILYVPYGIGKKVFETINKELENCKLPLK